MSLPGDSILVTPGSGATIATESVSSKEYPVIMQADAKGHIIGSGDVYVASAGAVAKSASKNILSVFNADASLKVDILTAAVYQSSTAAVTGLVRAYNLFRFTTVHSAGTSVTPVKLDTAMGALDADITVRKDGQTISGAESVALGIVGLGEEETGAGGAFAGWLFNWTLVGGWFITLNQNEGVVIQQDSTAGTGLANAVIVFRQR